MANFYVINGAYLANGKIGADNPTTFGLPQEGDGSDDIASTASATAFVTFSAPPTTGVFSVCSKTISTTGVIGAASADAAANQLATNINATTTPVNSTTAIGAPALKNLVYARGPSGGAPAGTCEVMMRVGSAALNYSAPNTECVLTTTFDNETSTAGNKQFSGGVGGCWGLATNTVTYGGSGATLVAGAYGVVSTSLPFVICSSSATTTQAQPGRRDRINLKSDGTTIAMGDNSLSWTNFTGPVWLNLDAGAIWSGSDAGFTYTFTLTGSNRSLNIGTHASGNKFFTLSATKRRKFVFTVLSWTGVGKMSVTVSNPSNPQGSTFRNLEFAETVGVAAWSGINSGGNYVGAKFQGCFFNWLAARAGVISPLATGGIFGYLIFEDCTAYQNLTGAGDPGAWFSGITFSGTRSLLRVSNCSFSGWSSALKLYSTISSPRLGNLIADGVSGVRIDNSAYIGLQQAPGNSDPMTGMSWYQSSDTGKTVRYEFPAGISEWLYGVANWPTLAATQKDGTPWSYRTFWPGTAGYVTNASPCESLPSSLDYREADAIKKITMEILVPTGLAIDEFLVAMRVGYVNASGVQLSESTFGVSGALATSTAAWTMNGATMDKYKLFLTTDEAIAQDTRITVRLQFNEQSPSGANVLVYSCPEFRIEAP